MIAEYQVRSSINSQVVQVSPSVKSDVISSPTIDCTFSSTGTHHHSHVHHSSKHKDTTGTPGGGSGGGGGSSALMSNNAESNCCNLFHDLVLSSYKLQL
jgi:hypothetical protein